MERLTKPNSDYCHDICGHANSCKKVREDTKRCRDFFLYERLKEYENIIEGRESDMSKVNCRNSEGYLDPTAYEAVQKMDKDEARFHKLLHSIFCLCDLANFEIEGRITLVDKKTGKVWR